ncbi:MAG: ThiF family adenylyltransferase [Phycisphaerales bacterium]|nr:ThiF family adenylyltransferase [Phycisphaerales bacterium]
MKEHSEEQCSALKDQVIVRIGKCHSDILTEHLRRDPHTEQFAFLLASRVEGPELTILIVRDVLLPGPGDLSEQSAGGVAPTPAFQRLVYTMAEAVGLNIIDVHTHLHPGRPRFSSIDTTVAAANGRYIGEHFEDDRITHVMIVFGNDVRFHDAVIFDRSTGKRCKCEIDHGGGSDELICGSSHARAARRCTGVRCRGQARQERRCTRRARGAREGRGGRGGGGRYRTIDRIEILGRGMELRETKARREAVGKKGELSERFARQRLVPGWEQECLAKQRIVIVGAGGNGAPLYQTLLSLGAGSEGWLAVVDPDVIEASNLPRIPYATTDVVAETGAASAQDLAGLVGVGGVGVVGVVGVGKVEMAARYARVRAPGTRVLTYAVEAADEAVLARIKEATLLIGAADNDGVRELLNECSVRYLIPYIDLGCDIQVDDAGWIVGGQVRVVIPGETACLLCCDGYDPAQAALDTMDPKRRAEHASIGYVRGSDAQAPTPSIANLNAMTAQLGVAAVLSLVHGPEFGAWDYVHFDPVKGEMVSASSKPRPDCPLCGAHGLLGAGDCGDESEEANAAAADDIADGTAMAPWPVGSSLSHEAAGATEEQEHDEC